MREGWGLFREIAKFHLACLRAALREVFKPAPFVDEAPQSTADATAARTAWITANKHPRECAGGCRCERR